MLTALPKAHSDPSNHLSADDSRGAEGRSGSTSEQSEGHPKKKRSFLNIPRSGSQAGEEATATGSGLSGNTVGDNAESIGKGSKRSFLGKRRAGSTASSKHSQKAKAPTTEKSTEHAQPSGAAGSPPQTPKKKGGISKLLSVLSCCGVPEEGNVVEHEEQAEAPKKATKLRSVRKSQPTPPASSKQKDTSAAESSMADSKDPVDEKAGEGHYNTSAGARLAKDGLEKPPQGDAQMDKPVPEVPAEEQAATEETYSPPPQEQPLPPAPVEPEHLDVHHDSESGPQVTVQTPTPLPEEEQQISDRTPAQQQRDTDIEMTDAGPSIPIAANEVPATEETGPEVVQTEAAPTKIDLPPPPPLADRQAQTAAPVQQVTPKSQESSLAVSPVEPPQKWLLPPIKPEFKGKKCLVLDLDETLVHSSFKILHQADFTIPVEIEGQYHNVYVIKRPGVDQFMKRVGELYEVVVFTASVSKYGDPLLDQLDIHGVVHHRLFRESCYNHQGNYVKDLSQVGRDLKETIIIDNSPTSYIFHPQHAVPISSWFSDAHDNELLDLIPVLEDLAGPQVSDVSLVLDVAL
ncbi:uncharacterized protein K452DRAFT_345642 [Aplosporella prunicola CBS 121167]|uniref:FCP1 homology domain-containing protein n=1 Tax=Aplosporella prunicola CBS 121167 TaxID=1176127 RepID=A0A6A6BKH8_9PEZI|nr:uncharacterized protein K452DRAFT_345642 [Aplosporella prunicola CBS 121167]KAF2144158.1 hypothetical protein K452DRAFT_345642 [Aplosporella prunicola CBS 121167]